MKKWIALILMVSSSIAFATPAQVIIIRHAEKPPRGNDLSALGYQHAQQLVAYFESNPDVTQYGPPAAIYAFGPGKGDTSERGIETVTPLAKALGMPIHSQFTKEQVEQVAVQIMSNSKYDGQMVLLCWERTMIADLAAAFGINPAPAPWGDNDFDTVFRIDFAVNGAVTQFQTFPQQL